MFHKTVRQQRGYSLIEAAIVLGIVGLIFGAIWAAAGSVGTQNKIRKATEMVAFSVQQIRGAYGSRANLVAASTTGANFTNALVSAEMLPREWTNSAGNVVNPWAGEFLVTPQTYTGSNYDGMNVSFSNMKQKDCYALAANILGGSRAQGLYQIDGQAINMNSTLTGIRTNICNGTTVSFHFSLKTSN